MKTVCSALGIGSMAGSEAQGGRVEQIGQGVTA